MPSYNEWKMNSEKKLFLLKKHFIYFFNCRSPKPLQLNLQIVIILCLNHVQFD